MPYTTVVDVMLILTRGDEVLLALRDGTGYADGMWNLPSGKLEEGEHALDAIVREAKEEIGIILQPDDLHFTGVVHCRNPEGEARLGLFFAAPSDTARQGEPYNAEPDKCAKLDWFPLTAPPERTVPYTTTGLDLHRTGEPFTTLGWEPILPTWNQASSATHTGSPAVPLGLTPRRNRLEHR